MRFGFHFLNWVPNARIWLSRSISSQSSSKTIQCVPLGCSNNFWALTLMGTIIFARPDGFWVRFGYHFLNWVPNARIWLSRSKSIQDPSQTIQGVLLGCINNVWALTLMGTIIAARPGPRFGAGRGLFWGGFWGAFGVPFFLPGTERQNLAKSIRIHSRPILNHPGRPPRVFKQCLGSYFDGNDHCCPPWTPVLGRDEGCFRVVLGCVLGSIF